MDDDRAPLKTKGSSGGSATIPDFSDPLLGTTIDARYRIERTLGAGGMGIVYEARHVELQKRLAVKVLRPEIAGDTVAIERFRREALAATTVGSPHIIDVVDFGRTSADEPYFVMEFLDGDPLSRILRAHSPLPMERAIHIAEQIATTLGEAHAAGIVHRDLKPDNVMLVERDGDRDFVKILDFGIAAFMHVPDKLTKPGEVFGSPDYMSPEQCRGEEVDPRSDVYAFGVLLYELVSGSRPFPPGSFFELVEAHLVEIPPPIRTRRRDCSADLEAVISRCLEKDPKDRYANCTLVASELRRMARGFAPIHAFRRTFRDLERGRRRRLVGLCASAGLALFAYAGYLQLRPSHTGLRQQVAVVQRASDGTPIAELVDVPIRLESTPEGAEVFIDGDLVGITPCDAPRPPSGRRFDLVLRKSSYLEHVVHISSATIGRSLHYVLTPEPTRHVAPVAATMPSVAPVPAPPQPRRRDNHIREVVDPWN